MKNKLVNKKVVSSIGIGIMAFVTAASPALTVLAEEDEPNNTSPETTAEQPSEPAASGEPQNAEVSGAIEGAQDAVNAAEKTVPATATDEQKDIRDNLEESDKNLEEIGNAVDSLDELNEKAEDEKTRLDKETENDEHIENAVTNASEAAEKINEIAAEIENNHVAKAEEEAKSAEDAQEAVYENSAAAQAAKEQAQENLAAAQVELAEAEKQNEAAETHVKNAAAACDYLEIRKNNAEIALNDAKTAVKAAEDALTEICEKYGIKPGETVGLTNIKGDALEAYNAAVKARNVAKASYENAETEAKKAEAAFNEASENYDKAVDEKAADEALKKATEEGIKAQDALWEAQQAVVRAQDEEARCQKAFDEEEQKLKEAESAAMEAAVNLKNKQDATIAAEKEEADAKKAAETAWENYNAVNESVDKALFDEAEKRQEAVKEKFESRDEDWNAYIDASNNLAETMIKYDLMKEEDITDVSKITFGTWESEKKDDNYVLVYYDGKPYGYYDYKPDEITGQVTVLKKELPDYVGEKNAKLTVSTNEAGDTIYLLNGKEVENEVTGNIKDGYTIKDGTKIETYKCDVIAGGKLVIETKYGQTTYTRYFDSGIKDTRTVKDVKIENGVLVSIKLGGIEYSFGEDKGKYIETVYEDETYANTNKFPNKGTELLKESSFDTAAGEFKTKLEQLKDTWDAADKAVEDAGIKVNEAKEAERQAETERDDARNTVTEIRDTTWKAANDALNKAKGDTVAAKSAETTAGNNILNAAGLVEKAKETQAHKEKAEAEALAALSNAQKEVERTGKKGAAALATQVAVDTAYNRVVDAIKSLSRLTDQDTVDEEAFNQLVEKYEKAKEDYLAAVAAQKVSQENRDRVAAAVERARIAAEGNFAYRTPTAPTTGGGTTGGGAGGTTGGGTGGTTAGGATGTDTPAAAPVVTIPTAAVPLAGPAVADGDEGQEAEELTLEDEMTPLAGPEEKDGAMSLTNFPMPSVGPVAEMGQMSWWWLLVVALFGATGAEMYRRHQKKQRKEANTEN